MAECTVSDKWHEPIYITLTTMTPQNKKNAYSNKINNHQQPQNTVCPVFWIPELNQLQQQAMYVPIGRFSLVKKCPDCSYTGVPGGLH